METQEFLEKLITKTVKTVIFHNGEMLCTAVGTLTNDEDGWGVAVNLGKEQECFIWLDPDKIQIQHSQIVKGIKIPKITYII